MATPSGVLSLSPADITAACNELSALAEKKDYFDALCVVDLAISSLKRLPDRKNEVSEPPVKKFCPEPSLKRPREASDAPSAKKARSDDPAYEGEKVVLNVRVEGVEYSPNTLIAFEPAFEQRSYGWMRKRFFDFINASIVAAILGNDPYSSYEKQFLRATGQTRRDPVVDTGNLLADHIRRGVHGEKMITAILEVYLRVPAPILEMPSVQCRDLPIMWASADGMTPGGDNVEIKMPCRIKLYECGRVTGSAICRIVPVTSGPAQSPAADIEEYMFNVSEGWIYVTCEACAKKMTTVYYDQIQAQAVTLDTRRSIFAPMRSPAVIEELLGIPRCIDKNMKPTYAERVEQFCERVKASKNPLEDIFKNRPVTDFVYLLYIPRQYDWLEKNRAVLEKFHAEVVEYREKNGITYEIWDQRVNQ